MTIEQQAQHVLELFPKYRFSLSVLIRLYMIQENFEVAEARIAQLAAGQVKEELIHSEIDRAEADLDPEAQLVFMYRQRNLKNAIAQLGGLMRETRFSPKKRQCQNALNALGEAMAFIDTIPEKADPNLFTDQTKDYLGQRIGRLKKTQAQLEAELADLEAWEKVEIQNGRFDLIPAETALAE